MKTILISLLCAGAAAAATLPPASEYKFNKSAVADLSGEDIGHVGPKGNTLSAGEPGVYSVSGGGRGIAGWDDAFHFASSAVAGETMTIARVEAVEGTKNARAGLMIRNSSIADSTQAALLVSNTGGLSLVSRRSPAHTSQVVASGAAGGLPVWLRLERSENTVTGSYSRDGDTWFPVGAVQHAFDETLLTGLAVSSGHTTSLATGVFTDVEQAKWEWVTPPPAPASAEVNVAPTAEQLRAAYAAKARAWTTLEARQARLGPTFEQLNPGALDTRPRLFQPTSKPGPSSNPRINPWEYGTAVSSDSDYWSDSGQVVYVPDDETKHAGIDRIATYAYYSKVFAVSPRLDWSSNTPRSDPQTREPTYIALNGGVTPTTPVAMVRNYGMRQNEALVVYRDGLFALTGTQTSRKGSERPFPGFKFPAHKVPTALAVTTSNEFALVTIWDTEQQKGQVAVVALEGKFLPFHTWPHIAFPNQGSWSDFKLLGYVDLPISMPSSISAASNGWWVSPGQTNNKVLSQIDIGLESNRKLLYTGGAWEEVVASSGYALIASQDEGQVVMLDLSPLFHYVRESYLSSIETFQQTQAARGAGDTQFPQVFAVKPEIAPRVIWQAAFNTPTAVLAGIRTERWTRDYIKGYIATRDGTVHVLNTSSLMARFTWQRKGPLGIVGSFQAGRNPVALAFTRYKDKNLPLLPLKSTGEQVEADPLNNTLWIACRGEREVRGAVTFEGAGAIYRTIADQRMGDPVGLSVAERGRVLSVADFNGRKMMSFLTNPIWDYRNQVTYGCGENGDEMVDFAGELAVPGHPFEVRSTNVN